jgi:hypothetical protein
VGLGATNGHRMASFVRRLVLARCLPGLLGFEAVSVLVRRVWSGKMVCAGSANT